MYGENVQEHESYDSVGKKTRGQGSSYVAITTRPRVRTTPLRWAITGELGERGDNR